MLPALSIINVGFLFVFGIFCLTFLSRYNKLKIVRLVRSNCPRLRIRTVVLPTRLNISSKLLPSAYAFYTKESVLRMNLRLIYLDLFSEGLIGATNKCSDITSIACTSCATNAMNVIDGIAREIIQNHVLDVSAHVQTTRGHIRCDQYATLTSIERGIVFCASLRRSITVQDGARIAFFVQEMIDSLAVFECVAEDDRALVLVLAQRVKQQP